jgi:hypothetical protein
VHALHTGQHREASGQNRGRGDSRGGDAGPQLVGAAADLTARNWFMGDPQGMVKSAVKPKSCSRCTESLLQGGVSAMKSKLLQKISYSQTHQSDEVLDSQQENIEDSSEPFEAIRNRTTRSNWLLMPRRLHKHSSQPEA